jgi:hypothetical protein
LPTVEKTSHRIIARHWLHDDRELYYGDAHMLYSGVLALFLGASGVGSEGKRVVARRAFAKTGVRIVQCRRLGSAKLGFED